MKIEIVERDLLRAGNKLNLASYSGSRNLKSITQKEYYLHEAESFEGFITGASVGFDHLIGEALVETYPKKEHYVVVPSNKRLVVNWWDKYHATARIQVIFLDSSTDYRDRNLLMVAASKKLFAHPEYEEHDPRSTRSGTWQTIRFSTKYHSLAASIIIEANTKDK